jgi:outer membrane protein OmpA-like peptidoglycan-associated protein
MRYPRRRTARRGAYGGGQDFWLSFSDLMSVLVLVFILVLFYILYKYFIINTAYENKLREMLVIEAALKTKETELTTAQSALVGREEDLLLAQGELTQAQEELARQQLLLNLAQQAMDESEDELKSKQLELDEALALLLTREDVLKSLQSQLDEKQAQLEGQQQQLEALVGVRTRIIRLLSETLKKNEISATVDPANGSIMLESDVLFAYGSAELTREGKAYIDKFLPAYLSVILASDNAEFVSEIIIEGHTDTTDTYMKNLKLSQNRAYAVAEYVLEDGNARLSAAQKNQLRELLTANGRSYADPVYDASGQVDAAASRRVAFKFRLTDEQMIEQMQEILEGDLGTGG